MENWDDQHFKSEWKQALEGAEVTPSEQVWTNIDARMMAAENASMKKRVVFYQRLAAASVGVMFLISGYAFFAMNDDEKNLAENAVTQQATVNPQLTSDPTTTPTTNSEIVENVEKEVTQENVVDSQINKPTVHSGSTGLLVFENNPGSAFSTIPTNSMEQTTSGNPYSVDKTQIVSSTTPYDDLNIALVPLKLNPALPKTIKPNDLAIAYRIADAIPATSKKKRKGISAEDGWAALGFAAGNFTQSASNLDLMMANSNAKTASTPFLADRSNSTKTEDTKPGSSYSMSISGGKRVAKRWLLHGGISYLNQNSKSNTSSVVIGQTFNTTGSIAPENFNAVTSTEESEINSTFQFISIPVQAGYMLVDQKFGVQLNGGFSPDVFLKSTVSDKASNETINTTGSNSTFKAVSVSGLGGVELSYRFSEHYRIALVPGFRYSLTPVYKENSLASAKPFMADIGLRFRYVF
jgi:hypothetical protein